MNFLVFLQKAMCKREICIAEYFVNEDLLIQFLNDINTIYRIIWLG